MINFLSKKGKVDWKKDKLLKNEIVQYDWVISYGYHHIIPGEIINKAKNPP